MRHSIMLIAVTAVILMAGTVRGMSAEGRESDRYSPPPRSRSQRCPADFRDDHRDDRDSNKWNSKDNHGDGGHATDSDSNKWNSKDDRNHLDNRDSKGFTDNNQRDHKFSAKDDHTGFEHLDNRDSKSDRDRDNDHHDDRDERCGKGDDSKLP